MTEPDNRTAEAEKLEHRYIGNHIPWYVHLLWLGFWILAIGYVGMFLLPAMRKELFPTP